MARAAQTLAPVLRYRPFLDHSLRAADAIIAATPAHISSSEQLSPVRETARFRVVPYGFDLSRFEPRPALADEIRGRFGGRFLIFALGRHVYYKGFGFLIRALASLPGAALALGGVLPAVYAARLNSLANSGAKESSTVCSDGL